jgi:hypothetical protein
MVFGIKVLNGGQEVRDKISISQKKDGKFVGGKNPKSKSFPEEVFNNIIIDLTNGYGTVKELANYYGVVEQRLYRHLYYNYIIFFDDLPEYLKKNIVRIH